jgi:serine/threonine protein kinase
MRLGVYEVTAPIGEGGMGQVYRATDTTLGRQVAIKILPDAFAADPERLARFEREAKTLASLNHPHIAATYAVEKSAPSTGSGQAVMHALVMELVEGEDLSQRIARGAIPIDDALPIAKQIADALEAAHEQGVVHRDLKPANIKVRNDGTEGARFRPRESDGVRTCVVAEHVDVAYHYDARDDAGRDYPGGGGEGVNRTRDITVPLFASPAQRPWPRCPESA